MKLFSSFLSIFFLVAIHFSFNIGSEKDVSGTYGGCCVESKVVLVLNEDQTFEYRDHSDVNNKITTSGSWALDGNVIQLSNYDAPQKIHHKWRVEKNGKAIKSRKGLAFYRLVKECK
ncbi:copper resistance protein NlpE [Salibacter halophilus]|uniref:Copper resistance protein NlpE n=1 Tax=Salibacter halophilus TaxID=1803916 RepID=A0A6N6MA10_9FLAO|nr:copper resistance protein NlpE [Salibacter halophilus]KAB1065550.1 copper resistance protein NlpE [Salibacter halophilus]